MKCLYCGLCDTLINLTHKLKTCNCGAVGGILIKPNDPRNEALFFGKHAIPIGLHNETMEEAIINQPEGGHGYDFGAVVWPSNSPVFLMVDKEKLTG